MLEVPKVQRQGLCSLPGEQTKQIHPTNLYLLFSASLDKFFEGWARGNGHMFNGLGLLLVRRLF